MKVNLPQLKKCISGIIDASSSNAQLLAMANILCVFTKTTAEFTATCVSVTAKSTMEGGFEPCEFLMTKNMAKYIMSLKGDAVDILHEDSSVIVRHGTNKAAFPCDDVRGFPIFPKIEDHVAELECAPLKDGISCSEVFIAKSSESRPTLAGVHVLTSMEGSYCYSCNGLNACKFNMNAELAPSEFTLTPDATGFIKKNLPSTGTVTVSMGDRHIFFEWDGITLAALKFSSKFPREATEAALSSAKTKDTVRFDPSVAIASIKRITLCMDKLSDVGLYVTGALSFSTLSKTSTEQMEAIEGGISTEIVLSDEGMLMALSKLSGEVSMSTLQNNRGVLLSDGTTTYYLTEYGISKA